MKSSGFLLSICNEGPDGDVERSSPNCGVDAADGDPDLELLRASGTPLLLSGSAECCRLSW